jgi:hypothetical protein
MMGSSSPPHLEAEDTGDIGSKEKKRPRRISGCEHTIFNDNMKHLEMSGLFRFTPQGKRKVFKPSER